VTHGLRWEFTDTWWAISSVTRFRIALHALHSSRPENLFGRQGEVAMYIPKWWSTTDLDATGIILQRLGCLSVGTALGGFCQRVAKNMWLWWALAIAIGFGLFVLAEYRTQVQNRIAPRASSIVVKRLIVVKRGSKPL